MDWKNIWKKVQRKESVQHCMRMIESFDGSGYAPHLVELYSLCDISVCIKDTEIPLCEDRKVRKSGDWGVFKEKRWVMLLSGYKEPV